MKIVLSKAMNLLSLISLICFLFFNCKSKPSNAINDGVASTEGGPANTGTVATRPSGKANISIKINGLTIPTAQLVGVFADQNFLADTFRVETGGVIKIKRDSAYRSGLYFLVFSNESNVQVILDTDQEFEMTSDINDLIGKMTVKGSTDNELLYEAIKLQTSQDAQARPLAMKAQGKPESDPDVQAYKKLQSEFRASRNKQLAEFTQKHPGLLVTKFRNAGQNPEVRDLRLANGQPDVTMQAYYFRNEYWNNTDLSDTRLISTPVIANKLKQYFGEITPQHQDSLIKQADFLLSKTLGNTELFKYISNWLLFKYEPGKTTLMDGEAVFAHIVTKFFTAQNASWLKPGDLRAIQQRAQEMSGSLLNKKALDVVAKDPNGNTKSIYEIKTPYIVVYLFHTDCEHCQELTPELSKMYPQLKSRGVEVFTIAVNTTDAEWKNFIKKYGMSNFINVFDPTNAAVYGKYFVDNTPEVYVLNKDRIIIGKNLKPNQINTIIDMDQKAGKK